MIINYFAYVCIERALLRGNIFQQVAGF